METAYAGLNRLSHLVDHFLTTKNVLVVRIGYGHSLGVPHLYDTHLKWQSDVPVGTM